MVYLSKACVETGLFTEVIPMSKFAVILYPDFSLQEITCLTSALSVWFEEKIDFIASENREYCSEEGLRVMPTKTIADVNITDYKSIRFPHFMMIG